MKKILLYVLGITLLISGCTPKEQDKKITEVWKEKITSFLVQRLGMRPAESSRTIPEEMLLDEQGNPLFPQEGTDQEQSSQGQHKPIDEPGKQENPAAEESVKKPTVNSTDTVTANPIASLPPNISVKAVLFTHADSPKSKQLKADNWDKKFLEKYQGRVFLVEYDMKNPASKAPLQEMMQKHKLSTITVPILFVGDQNFQKYPFGNTDMAVQEALIAAAQAKQPSAQKRKKQPNQFMEIIMEDTPKARKINTKASARDSRAMQLALAKVEQNNQATLADMGALFGENAKAQAYVIISRTERLLRNKASSSPDYKTY